MRKQGKRYIEISDSAYQVLVRVAAKLSFRSPTAYLEDFAKRNKEKVAKALPPHNPREVIKRYNYWIKEGFTSFVEDYEWVAKQFSEDFKTTPEQCKETIERWKRRHKA
jgi:hypothetical protein